jgi:hypothetical protein
MVSGQGLQGNNPRDLLDMNWVVPRACPDAVQKRKLSCPCRESNRGGPALGPSACPLSYPGYPHATKYEDSETGNGIPRITLVCSPMQEDEGQQQTRRNGNIVDWRKQVIILTQYKRNCNRS